MTVTTSDKREFFTDAPLSGELLAEKLRQDLLPPQEALSYAIDIGNALSRAHLAGLVHGAVSPYSIVITESGAALAKPYSPPTGIADAYRSPEQVLGQAPDWRSDIFSFGVLLYEMVNGDPAFTGEAPNWTAPPWNALPLRCYPDRQFIPGWRASSPAASRKTLRATAERIQNAVNELKLAGRSLPRIADALQRSLAKRAPVPGDAIPTSASLSPMTLHPFLLFA